VPHGSALFFAPSTTLRRAQRSAEQGFQTLPESSCGGTCLHVPRSGSRRVRHRPKQRVTEFVWSKKQLRAKAQLASNSISWFLDFYFKFSAFQFFSFFP
jgi:hypothetical protein